MDAKGMKVKTNVKAGGLRFNHNETMVRDAAKAKGLTVRTHVKAGWWDGPMFTYLVWRGGW